MTISNCVEQQLPETTYPTQRTNKTSNILFQKLNPELQITNMAYVTARPPIPLYRKEEEWRHGI